MQGSDQVDGDMTALRRPDYYKASGGTFDVIDVVQRYDLGFELGNVVKYLVRSGKKGYMRPDLEKAAEYCRRWLALEADLSHNFSHDYMNGSDGADWMSPSAIVEAFGLTDIRLGNAILHILDAANHTDEDEHVQKALDLIDLELEGCAP